MTTTTALGTWQQQTQVLFVETKDPKDMASCARAVRIPAQHHISAAELLALAIKA